MADVAWPSTLPKQAYGFTEAPANVLASFSPGPWQKPLRRKRVSGKASIVSYTFVFTSAQMATFRSWWDSDLASGANDITFYDYALSASVRLTPLAEYQATNLAPNAYQVQIEARRELA